AGDVAALPPGEGERARRDRAVHAEGAVTRRLFTAAALVALVVLASRALVYALEPSPLARELGADTPGPRALVVGAGAAALGLACLLGPVHRDALPFIAALSAVGAAAAAAAGHLLAWMRRTLALLVRTSVPRPPRTSRPRLVPFTPPASHVERSGSARGPPRGADPGKRSNEEIHMI